MLAVLGIPTWIGRSLGRAAIRIGVPRRHHRTPIELRTEAPLPEGFELHTFVNDEDQYREMRRSFEQTGFETFVRLSDTEETPFEAIERIGRRRGPRYVILCHQDVRAEADAAHLTALLAELDTIDPGWVVAGNAGVTPKMRVIRKLSDPHGGSTPEPCPQPAITLDENFLVFKRSQRPQLTPGLSGFHFYGTDACLNALARGGGAYVIDFPVTHLSRGNRDPSYGAIRRQFIDAWNGASLFRYAATPSEVLFFSRSRTLRRIFGHPRALSWVGQHRRTADDVWRTIDSPGVAPPGSIKSAP